MRVEYDVNGALLFTSRTPQIQKQNSAQRLIYDSNWMLRMCRKCDRSAQMFVILLLFVFESRVFHAIVKKKHLLIKYNFKLAKYLNNIKV